jgi:hypothetical protein
MLDYTNKIYYAIKNSVPEVFRPYVKIKARASGWYEVCYGMVTAYYCMTPEGEIVSIEVD